MPPSMSSIHINKPLTNVAIQYSQEGLFISNMALPLLPVKKKSDLYFVFQLKDTIKRSVNTLRAPGTEAKMDSYESGTDTYSCHTFALKDPIPDEIRENADKPLDLDIDTTQFLTGRIMLDKEIRVKDVLFDTTGFAGFTTALSAANQWDNYTSADSNPIEDITKTAKQSVIKNSLQIINTVILGDEVFDALTLHPLILDKIKYGGSNADPAVVTEKALAALFKVNKVLVGRAVYNSAAEGQTPVPTSVWGKFALAAYIAPRPPLKGITLGFQPEWKKFRTKKWREDKLESDMVEVTESSDQVISVYGAGYLFSTVIS